MVAILLSLEREERRHYHEGVAKEHKELTRRSRIHFRAAISRSVADHVEEGNNPSVQGEQHEDEDGVVGVGDLVEEDEDGQAHGEDRPEQLEPVHREAEGRKPGEVDDEPDAQEREPREPGDLGEEAELVVVVHGAALRLVLVVGEGRVAVGLGLLLVLLVVWRLLRSGLGAARGLCDYRTVGNDVVVNLGVRHLSYVFLWIFSRFLCDYFLLFVVLFVLFLLLFFCFLLFRF